MTASSEIEVVIPLVREIRGRRVIMDSDLARLYGASTKRLNEQVRRNPKRFPADFGFRLNPAEVANLRSQFATSSGGWGGRRYLPFVFTEYGVVMAANVLNSERAVGMSIEVVKAFIRLRKAALSHGVVARKLAELERAVKSRLDQHDLEIEELFEAVESLIGSDGKPIDPKPIGFAPES